jgi:dTDP-4-dehydrorhamnose 3,5-epimerase
MNAAPFAFPDFVLLEGRVFGGDRGFYFQSVNQFHFEPAFRRMANFIQDNRSGSAKNLLRGWHFQLPPKAQGRPVRAARGEVCV